MVSDALPVRACTSKFNLLSILTATEPTPPVAPETKIGRLLFTLASISFFTQAAAVSPAVPISITSSNDRLDGILTIQFSGTLIISPKPPLTDIPIL